LFGLLNKHDDSSSTSNSTAAPTLKDELRISAAQLGVLLSAFFWTYACMIKVSAWRVFQ